MATSRQIRRLALQALYQLDVHEGDRDRAVSAWVAETQDLSTEDRDEALRMAYDAYKDRDAADAALKRLAPTWPAERQPAVDRAILRLAHFEMSKGAAAAKPKVVINDAIELAKEFSTDKSPRFINGVLDAILKELAQRRGDPKKTEAGADTGASPTP